MVEATGMNGGLFDEPYVMHVIEPVWLPVDYGLFPSPFVVPFPTERSRRTTLSGARDVWRTWHRRDHCRHRHRDARIRKSGARLSWCPLRPTALGRPLPFTPIDAGRRPFTPGRVQDRHGCVHRGRGACGDHRRPRTERAVVPRLHRRIGRHAARRGHAVPVSAHLRRQRSQARRARAAAAVRRKRSPLARRTAAGPEALCATSPWTRSTLRPVRGCLTAAGRSRGRRSTRTTRAHIARPDSARTPTTRPIARSRRRSTTGRCR